jgi:hypothetical protein
MEAFPEERYATDLGAIVGLLAAGACHGGNRAFLRAVKASAGAIQESPELADETCAFPGSWSASARLCAAGNCGFSPGEGPRCNQGFGDSPAGGMPVIRWRALNRSEPNRSPNRLDGVHGE